ncbi:mucin-5AC-like [Fundulus heteroclitus]|uniref:mucin-5AC-like n=1 Tax=Fundulus heteroclitus TaxID=8078 RepID=UPI00165C7741|nr:mucin-5AC-like [Fundulus heteroclitus]
MFLFVYLVLLLVSGAQTGFYGVVYTYSFLDLQESGYFVINNEKLSFSSCEEYDLFVCSGNCSGQPVFTIDESRGEWCQKEFLFALPNASLTTFYTPAVYSNWTENRNGIELSAAEVRIELRNRSDIHKPNSSPRTNILPLVRVPSNCQRNINLLVSDPDGDEVRCRYAAGLECHTCTPPSVLTVSPACTLSFSPTNSSAEGPYAVQLTVEDFPRQSIILTNGSNSQEVITTSNSLSKIPVQFVFRVDPAAPSCTEGVYLPRFLPPTPENGAQIYTDVNQTVQINIRAEATQAVITELLFSGPLNVAKSSSGSGNFTLTWTPSAIDAELSHTFCFVVQANSSSSVYQSDLRCIFVTTRSNPTTPIPLTTTTATLTPSFTTTPPPNTTRQQTTTTTTLSSTIPNSTPNPGPYYVLALNAKISTTLSLKNNTEAILQQMKDELIRQGLPSDIILKLINSVELEVTIT